jgi:hypothetical protein
MTDMSLARRTFQIGFVWFTAVATLFAGVPRFDCACPNGARKSVSIGFSTPSSDCCCAGSCCARSEETPHQARSASATTHGGQRSCCKGKSRSGTGEAPSGDQVQGRCCHRALANTDVAVLTVEKTMAKQDVTDIVAAVPAQAASASCVPTRADRFGPPENTQAPPTDLVITLQHFLI